MANRAPWRLAELALGDVKDAPPEVAVLPFGATEPHGMHLPYGTDIYEVEAFADRACRLATERGASVALLPVIPFGVQTSQNKFPLAMNLYPSTLNRIIGDLTETLANSGVKKAVLLNGHGGNDFYTHLRELYGKRDIFLVQVDWYRMCPEPAGELFPSSGDHANDMETSLMRHLYPDLVDMEKAGAQQTATPRFGAMREGWARAPRPWERFTEDSGAGDPRAATAQKGEQYFEAVSQKLAEFLVELAGAEMDESFPFEPES